MGLNEEEEQKNNKKSSHESGTWGKILQRLKWVHVHELLRKILGKI